MKVAITGHTGGIGRAIADAFRERGHEVVGLSRSTGYDLARPERIVDAAEDCDVLVNNRHQYDDDSQLRVLFLMAERWRGRDRLIVNLGSRAGECYVQGRVDPYSIYKHALDAACEQLTSRPDQLPRVVNVRPGFVDTDSVKGHRAFKLGPPDVARVVMWIVEQPPHVHVSSVTLSHHTTGTPPPRPDLARRAYWGLRGAASSLVRRVSGPRSNGSGR